MRCRSARANWSGPANASPKRAGIAQSSRSVRSTARSRIICFEYPKAADAFDFKSIPTLILLKDGGVMQQFTGLQRKETLVAAIGQVAVG